MAGTIKVDNVVLGTSATPSQNFVLKTNADGTAVLARGNLGATTQDILTVESDGKVTMEQGQVYTPAGTGAVATTVQSKLRESVSVKDFGAVGDGVADDTAAIQAAVNFLENNQFPINGEQWTYTLAELFFPQGTYKITAAVEVRCLVILSGVGNAYVAGSTIRQATPDTDIFKMICSGSDVHGLNFEFESTGGSGYGYALHYHAVDTQSPFAAVISNSHYIRDNRCGGYHRYGRFLRLENSNDVEISRNTVDVVNPGQAIVIGSQDQDFICSDVRIIGNNFFTCDESLVIYKAMSVSIVGNSFSNHQSTGSAIKLATDSATIAEGSILGVNITSNIFWRQYNALKFDASASDVIYSNNTHTECLAEPLVAIGATAYRRFKFHNNYFHLSVAGVAPYPYTYSYANCPFAFGAAQMYDSEICDNTVDANGINTVVRLFASATLTYVFGSGMVLRNNKILNNTSYPGRQATHVPMSADDLVVTASRQFSDYPVNQLMFNFNTGGIDIESYATFYVDYLVVCDKPGSFVTSRMGTVKVSFARLSASTADTKWNVAAVASTGDDTGGGSALPTVSFSGTSSLTGSGLLVTVSGGVPSPFTTYIKAKAYGFTSFGNAQIQSS